MRFFLWAVATIAATSVTTNVEAASCKFKQDYSLLDVSVDVTKNSMSFDFWSHISDGCDGIEGSAGFRLTGTKDFNTGDSLVDISIFKSNHTIGTYTSQLSGSARRFLHPEYHLPLVKTVWTFDTPKASMESAPSLFPGGFRIYTCVEPNGCFGEITTFDHAFWNADGHDVGRYGDYVAVDAWYYEAAIAPVPLPMTGTLALSAFSLLLLHSRQFSKKAKPLV